MMETISICPQTIFKFDIPSEMLANAITETNKLEYEINKYNLVSDHSNIFDLPGFAELGAWSQTCVDEVNSQVYGLESIKITQSWANRAQTGMWHHTHKHPNSFVSGTMCLTTNDARTWFSLDDMWHNYTSVLELINDNGQIPEVIHKEETVAGKLLIFPSSLVHSVDENKNDHERLSISFNSFIRGTIGSLNHRLTI